MTTTKVKKFPAGSTYSINPDQIAAEIATFLQTKPTPPVIKRTVVSIAATSLFDGKNGQNAAYLIYTEQTK